MFVENVTYSKDLEYAILGACMLEKDAFGRVFKILDKDVFYYTGHGTIFSTLSEMWNKSLPIDMLSVYLKMYSDGIPEINGYSTAWYICQCTKYVVGTSSLEYHAVLLRNMYVEREVYNITHAGTGKNAGFDAIKEIEKKLNRLRDKVVLDDFKGIDEVMVNLYQHMDSVKDKELTGITTGFKTLDKNTGGFQNGGLYILAARPSVGKSAFMGKSAFNAAKNDYYVGIISLEMTDNQIGARIASLASDIEYWRIYRNRMIDEDQRQYLYKKAQELAELPIMISDKTGVNIGDIKAKIARLRAKSKIDILFIDYLQLLDTDDKARNVNREQQISQISRGLKLLAKDYNIPIVVLAQLNRLSEQTADKKPKLHNLRESGSLEQDADGVIFLHRDWMSGIKENENGNSTESEADVIIAKWRDGAVMEYKIGFNGTKMNFHEFEENNFNTSSTWKPYNEN